MSKITSTMCHYLWKTNVFSNKNLGILLEPINTIIKLSLLKHFPKGTKISIKDNVILFQEPSSTQGFMRWSKGDKYEDLHNLVNPIKKFISSKSKKHIWENLENFIYLCNEAILGLDTLSKTYENNKIANHTIEFYKSLILENLNDKSHFLDQLETSISIPNGFYDIYEEFFKDWNDNQINIIVHLLQCINKTTKIEIKNAYIENVENIIQAQDTRMKKTIEKVQSGTI